MSIYFNIGYTTRYIYIFVAAPWIWPLRSCTEKINWRYSSLLLQLLALMETRNIHVHHRNTPTVYISMGNSCSIEWTKHRAEICWIYHKVFDLVSNNEVSTTLCLFYFSKMDNQMHAPIWRLKWQRENPNKHLNSQANCSSWLPHIHLIFLSQSISRISPMVDPYINGTIPLS